MTYIRGDGKPDSQPMPDGGSQSVLSWLRATFGSTLDNRIYVLLEERTVLGIKRYGTPLMSFNGRDALQDALEEEIDGLQYIAQAAMEAEVRHNEAAFHILENLLSMKVAMIASLLILVGHKSDAVRS